MSKEDSKKEELKFYDVKVEANIPAILHYRILAKSPRHAEYLVKYRDPQKIEYKVNKRKNIFLRIYDAGTVIVQIAKSLL